MGTTLEDILRLGQQLTTPDQQAPQQMPVARPSTVVGLLGSALGGGSSGNVGLTQEQADAEGRGALLNFGLNMLEASGYSNRKRGLGEIFAKGVRGAQGAIGDYESQLAARQAALQAQQQQSLENRFKGIDAASKIAEMQQKLKQLQTVAGMTLDGKPGTSVASGDDIYSLPKEQFLAAVAKRESGGDPTAMNYVAKADPTAWDRGATATGKYQMVASTWRTAAKLAGIDTTKYPRAMDAPEADQDRAASLLYDAQGTNPWNPAKFGQHWVKDEKTGKYQLVQGAGEATGGGKGPPETTAKTTPPAETKSATTALPTPPEPPEGMLPSPVRPEPSTAPASNVGRGPGGAVVAGPPGAATVGPAQPAGPEVSGDVAAIARGMVSAGADPTTLAAGARSGGSGTLAAGPAGGETTARAAAVAQAQATNTPTQVEGVPGLWALPNGSVINRTPSVGLPGTISPGPVPPAQQPPPEVKPPPVTPTVIPQGTPQQPGVEPFKYVPSPLPDDLKQYTTKELQPQQLKDIQARRAEAQQAFDQARSINNTDDMRKARERLAKVNEDEANLLQTQSGDVQKMVQEFYGKDFDQQRKAYDDRQAHARALEIEANKQKNAIELEQTKTGLATGSKIMDDLNAKSVASRQKIDNLDFLSIISAGVDDDGLARKLSTMKWGNTTAANVLALSGLTSDDFKDKVGKINQLQAMINNTVTAMRQGTPMGSLSDRDLAFIQAMGPDLYQNKATRESIIRLLRETAIRQSRFSNEVGRLWDDGKGMKIHDAITQAGEKLERDNPIIPAFTAEEQADPAKFSAFAKKHHLQRGALIRNPNGDLGTLN